MSNRFPYIEAPFSGTRWYHERYLLDAFSAAGFTMRSLRDFFRALGIPKICLPTGTFYDGMSLSIGMKAIGRIGQDDFAAPGSPEKANGYAKRSKMSLRLDPQYVRDNVSILLAEMWAAKPEAFHERPKLEKEAKRVGDALVTYAVLNRAAREERDAHAAKCVRTAVHETSDPDTFNGAVQ